MHLDPIHLTITTLALTSAWFLFRWTGPPWDAPWWHKAAVALGACCGGVIAAKLPFVLADLDGLLTGEAWFAPGKTILAGLLGGYIGARLVEWAMDIEVPHCDRFAVPTAVAVAIGRLGCFHQGCCRGKETVLAWGVDFGDGISRHPTQLYETAFHLTAALVLLWLPRTGRLKGMLIRVYFAAYFIFRFATEFLRTEEPLWLSLTGYQWATLVLLPLMAFWCCPGVNARTLLAGRMFPWRRRRLRPVDEPTKTLCPECFKPVAGTLRQLGQRVFLDRTCPEHGPARALVASDRRHYYLRDEVPHPPHERREEPVCGCGDGCCGDGTHKTCVALLEVTEACDLACPVCYARSGAQSHRPLDALLEDLDAFLDARGPLDILQISGGEPLLHPELLEMIDAARARPIDHVMINTNGLALLEPANVDLTAQLALRRPHLEICLQFDGFRTSTWNTLRGEDLAAKKRRVLDQLIEHGLPTTLVCTILRGVNEDEMGPIVELARQTPTVRGITFQPATWCGRFLPEVEPIDRVTLADVITGLTTQTAGRLRPSDFVPLPCSHPNCCSVTVLARKQPGRLRRFFRRLAYQEHLDRLADRINFNLSDAEACCGTDSATPNDFLRIAIKPFMDVHTYDAARIRECCIHVIRPAGTAISFCHFNTLGRSG